MRIGSGLRGIVKIIFSANDYVPVQNRAAWLEAHPWAPADVPVSCGAPLLAWERAGIALDCDGVPEPRAAAELLKDAIVEEIQKSPDFRAPDCRTPAGFSAEAHAAIASSPIFAWALGTAGEPREILFTATALLESAAIEQAREAAQARAEAAKKEADAKAIADRLLALPAEAILGEDGSFIVQESPADPEVYAILDYLLGLGRPRYNIRAAELVADRIKELKALRDAAHERIAAAERRHAEQRAEECRNWLAEQPNFGAPEIARAAREKRSVTAALESYLCQSVTRAVEGLLKAGELGRWIESFGEDERRGVPSKEAYALFDALIEGRTAIAAAAELPGAVVEVGPISRFDVAPKGDPVWRTGVKVTVTHPWISSSISVPVTCEANDGADDE